MKLHGLVVTLAVAGAMAASPALSSQLDRVAAQVGAGYDHSCTLTSDGAVKCWGNNFYGQVGDATNTQRNTPVDVSTLASGVAALAVGGAHACALTTAGGVKCWGNDYYGQLGDNLNVDRPVPVAVAGLGSGVAAIAAGGNQTCALTAGGGVKCWGRNDSGQVGDGTTTHRAAPVDVQGLPSVVVAVAVGGTHACALDSGGGVKCWGGNASGQLGDGTTTQRLSPVGVVGLGSDVVAITAGEFHSCALVADGSARCWGGNFAGQLGDGTTTQRPAPVGVAGLYLGVISISAGGQHTCAAEAGGRLSCWGDNLSGQLGDGTLTNQPMPSFAHQSDVVAVAAGSLHTCAQTTGGGLRCWGFNAHGTLGDGGTDQRSRAADVVGFSGPVRGISAGTSHVCVPTSAGGAKCWGANDLGALGDGTTAQRSTPVDVVGLGFGVTSVQAGGGHTCALVAGNGVKCWGNNAYGQLGDNSTTQRNVPVDVAGLTSGVSGLYMGLEHSCARTSGGLMCWGFNGTGALGDGTFTDRTTPVAVGGLGYVGVYSVAPGWAHTCAVVGLPMNHYPGYGVKCWGSNQYGNLGGDPAFFSATPVDVPSLTGGVSAVTSGLFHTCALTATGVPNTGAVKCWGLNSSGQLGNGSTTNSPVPVDVPGVGSNVTMIEAGHNFTCAVTSVGAVMCWGDNSAGQLGDGTTTQRLSPVAVSGLSSGVAIIAAGQSHACALLLGGEVRCWGSNFSGQLGNGTTTDTTTPGYLRRTQSIAFARPAPVIVGVPVSLAALASSGLAVSYDTWTPGTCTLSGGTLTPVAPGLCGVRASQAGDGHHAPASPKSWLIRVNAPCDPGAAGDCDDDGIPNGVEPGEGRDPVVKDNDVFGNARLFAMQQYRDVFGREGDAPGIAFWTDAVANAVATRAAVIDGFIRSTEFEGFVAPVVRLYFATFVRVPDSVGLAFNAGLVRDGTITLQQLADFFTTSPEFLATYGALTDAEFVTLLYQNVLGRPPEAAGLAGWTGLLASGYTRGQVLLGFSESVEYQGAMANEVLVTMMYTAMLRRAPDPAGFGGWVAFLDAGTYTREQVINGFFLSAEYHDRFLP